MPRVRLMPQIAAATMSSPAMRRIRDAPQHAAAAISDAEMPPCRRLQANVRRGASQRRDHLRRSRRLIF